MSPEGEGRDLEQPKAVDVERWQRVTDQKIYVQEEVMKKLDFLPASFNRNNFDPANYQFSKEVEGLISDWSTVLNQNEESISAVFEKLYTEEVKKYSELLSEEEIQKVSENIATKLSAMASQWN